MAPDYEAATFNFVLFIIAFLSSVTHFRARFFLFRRTANASSIITIIIIIIPVIHKRLCCYLILICFSVSMSTIFTTGTITCMLYVVFPLIQFPHISSKIKNF